MLNCDAKKIINDDDNGNDALEASVAQREDVPISGADGELCPTITCHKWKKMGHY